MADIRDLNGFRRSIRKEIWGSDAPSSGTYEAGDLCRNTAPTAAEAISHWICVSGGTPGTWRAVGCGTGDTASRPTLGTNDAGYLYYDTDDSGIVYWDGSSWQAI